MEKIYISKLHCRYFEKRVKIKTNTEKISKTINMNTVEEGRLGEDIACNYLIEKGFTIEDRNWRCGHLEIDIVARHKNVDNFLHIVEVKARTVPIALEPASAVDERKQWHVIAAARGYLRIKMLKGEDVVFDIIAISFFADHTDIQYIPNAYQPRW